MTINDFNKDKKISMITCYDFWSAALINQSNVDTILVGDSVAMVSHGYNSTLPATVELMEMHTSAVRRGAPDKFIIADMPFLSHRKSIDSVLESVRKLMSAGANAIKIEGLKGHEETIKYIVDSGVPVLGHLGLTPQSFNSFGGFKLQSKTEEATLQLLEDGKKLEELGCFGVVLECVPDSVGKRVTDALSIPTIGIGAGDSCNGQVLVLQDMLGVTTGYTPKFVRKFINGSELIKKALNEYDSSVKSGEFPAEGESYGG